MYICGLVHIHIFIGSLPRDGLQAVTSVSNTFSNKSNKLLAEMADSRAGIGKSRDDSEASCAARK